MQVSLYRIGSAAAVGYCAGVLANANPTASATFVVLTSLIYGIATEVLYNTNTGTSSRILAHGSSAILCGAAVCAYKITEKLVSSIAMEALGKVTLFATLIYIASPGYSTSKATRI